jgi:alpha-galactosidase
MTRIQFTEIIQKPQIIKTKEIQLVLPAPPVRFYRHGWQSWTLTAWIDPATPAMPVRAAEFRTKDEDPLYAMSKKHTSAWVAAADMGNGSIILLGGLGLGARIQLDGESMVGFYETGEDEWLIAQGNESDVFQKYADELKKRFGPRRIEKEPRVWCSWYSLYGLINERVLRRTIREIGDLPFDVIQIDDGWQVSTGEWDANSKFPSGMKDLADRIKATGRTAGLWLSPFIVTLDSKLCQDHPDWLLRNEKGAPIFTGRNWSGMTYALDVTHPAVLEWLDKLIRKVRSWGYEYLKLDFLYAAAFPGLQRSPAPREEAYRNAMRVIREAAGDAHILACGAPILPTLGLCDGLRIGTDVTPFWLNTPFSIWLNNPNHPGTQNAIRMCIHRQWLKELTHIDPDVVYFRSRNMLLTKEQKQLLVDLALICGFKVTSDPPQWLTEQERGELRDFLEADPVIEQVDAYRFRIDGREVDFSPVIPLPHSKNVPVWLAKNLGLVMMGIREALPAHLEARKK